MSKLSNPELVLKARTALQQLLNGKYSLRVPPNEDEDPDFIIAEITERFEKYARAVELFKDTAQKFIAKVEARQARSVETYRGLSQAFALLEEERPFETLTTLLLRVLTIENSELRIVRAPRANGFGLDINFYRFGEYAVTLKAGDNEQILIKTLQEFCNEIDQLTNENK